MEVTRHSTESLSPSDGVLELVGNCYRVQQPVSKSLVISGHRVIVSATHRQALSEPAVYPHQVRFNYWTCFASKKRAEWCAIFEGTDACFAPVSSMTEAPLHPHNRARDTFATIGGVVQPDPAPHFFRIPGEIQGPPYEPEADADWILSNWVRE